MIAGGGGRGGAKRIVVLSSQRAFETLVGPLPETMRTGFVFLKPRRDVRLQGTLSDARLVVSQSYFRPEVNRWIFEARRRGVPTMLLVDGPLEWTNVHASPGLARPGAEAARALHDPIVHDAVAAIGDAQARFIESRNRGRGIVFLSYANRRILTAPLSGAPDFATPGSSASGSRPESSPAAPKPVFDFLLTTARTAAFDAAERESLEKALRDCLAALDRSGHRTLVRLFDDGLRSALEPTTTRAHFDATGSFTAALAQCRCVIGTPSSVLLEAMHHDRPTATLVFRDSPLFDRTGWLLGGFADWEASFAAMLARDPARMAFQRDALRESLSERDFYEQLRDLVDGDALEAPRPLDARDLEFENHVLRRVAGLRARLFLPLYRALRAVRGLDRPPRA